MKPKLPQIQSEIKPNYIMNKNFFIIGDVHGCLKTFQKLISFWDPEKEILIQVGDLIDRGNFSPQTIHFCISLQKQHPGKVILLRGNHEQLMLDYYQKISNSWLMNGGRQTISQFESSELQPKDILPWLSRLNLIYDTKHFYISHAGVSDAGNNPLDPRNPNGILWNRNPLKNIGKTQIIGHTPLEEGKPAYYALNNYWNIDTGAYRGICLSGIKFDNNGNFIKTISISTIAEDINVSS